LGFPVPDFDLEQKRIQAEKTFTRALFMVIERLKNESGQVMTEYALLTTLVAIVAGIVGASLLYPLIEYYRFITFIIELPFP